MLNRIRADWRRGRARKFIELNKNWTFEYDTRAGPITIAGQFRAEDTTLVLVLWDIHSKDALETGGDRPDAGVGEVRRFLEWVAGMAADLGYTRLRVKGSRTKRGGMSQIEFDLARYLRSPGRSR